VLQNSPEASVMYEQRRSVSHLKPRMIPGVGKFRLTCQHTDASPLTDKLRTKQNSILQQSGHTAAAEGSWTVTFLHVLLNSNDAKLKRNYLDHPIQLGHDDQ